MGKPENNHCCDEMSQLLNEKKVAINYDCKFREYSVELSMDQDITQKIHFCPWCGEKLPSGLRDRWFRELEKFGYDDPWEQDIPENFLSDKWWRDMNL